MRDAAQSHAAKVDRVATQLRRRQSSAPLSIRKRVVSHQVPKRGDLKYRDEKIDVSDLDEILEIDPETRTCTAEPGVTFEALVRATLPLGLVPRLVPEFRTITIGGAVSGCSVESTSFRYGGFHDTCLEYEVVTARGEVIRCAPDDEDSLLFQMLHGSFGTLGILTKLKFSLMPAAPYVHVAYERYASLAAFERAVYGHFERGDLDFMDGFIHGPSCCVLNVGRFVRQAPYRNHYNWTKVYYQSTLRRSEDYLRTEDYFFRYDHGVTNVHPKSFVGRLLFGKLMGSSAQLWLAEKFNRLIPKTPSVTVDVFVPLSRLQSFFAWYSESFAHYPIWCVPYLRVQDYPWLGTSFYDGNPDRLFVDLAIYGMRQQPGRNHYQELEAKLPEFNGVKTLISHNYYDEATFWQVFNKTNYLAVKRRTDPDNVFRDLYRKTCMAACGLEA